MFLKEEGKDTWRKSKSIIDQMAIDFQASIKHENLRMDTKRKTQYELNKINFAKDFIT